MKFIKTILTILITAVLVLSCTKDSEIEPQNISNVNPFPNHTNYVGNHIKPSNYNQTDLDNQTSIYYTQWKNAYLKNDCIENEYYIYSGNEAKTISEAHGYGMMIMCFMAGYETNAKAYFDGLYQYYKSHPSNNNHHLMDWQQITCNEQNSDDDDAASDGDIDIAFSLLLAHKQWGSNGTINYLEEAKTIINAIMQDEINSNTNVVKLGDWCDTDNSDYYFGTRSSDFITSHFKVFANTTNSNWNLVVDECYHLINTIQSNQSTTTGLIPDFIINTNTNPVPAEQNYLEDVYDGDYYYNACRFPWRIGTDYLTSGDSRAKTAINTINSWLISSTNGNVNTISNGYKLDGTPIYTWNDATFIAPFAVGAMANTSNQVWLNSLYSKLIDDNDFQDGDYYSNTIQLLSMIVISGNYWNP